LFDDFLFARASVEYFREPFTAGGGGPKSLLSRWGIVLREFCEELLTAKFVGDFEARLNAINSQLLH